MAREKDGYRENLELLNEMFPGTLMLSMDQVMTVVGCTDRRTLRRRMEKYQKFWAGNQLSKVYLAKYMCG